MRTVRKKTIFVFLIILGSLAIEACGKSLPAPGTASPRLGTASWNTLSISKTPTSSRTASPTLTATKTASVTRTRTNTPTPTEDLSFYSAAACLPQNTAFQRAFVTKVVDGDTIEIQTGDGITSTIRYIGIDAAESGYPYFEEGRAANASLVDQKEVILIRDQSDTDLYQRRLRYVIADGLFVNLELLRLGLAKAENYPPDEACQELFRGAEQEARDNAVGMWSATPTPDPLAGRVVILSVNKREEWVEIQNVGASDVDLSGWKLVSERGNQDCPLSGTIKAGEILRIWSMQAEGQGFSCGYSSPIWNNSEPDPAVLYNADGVEVSRK